MKLSEIKVEILSQSMGKSWTWGAVGWLKGNTITISTICNWTTDKEAKEDWEIFAKETGITNWKWD